MCPLVVAQAKEEVGLLDGRIYELQEMIGARSAASRGSMKPPLAFRTLGAIPFLRRIPARMVGLGFRREHVAKYITDPKGD